MIGVHHYRHSVQHRKTKVEGGRNGIYYKFNIPLEALSEGVLFVHIDGKMNLPILLFIAQE